MNIGLAALIGVLAFAVVSDIRRGRVPNLFVVFGTVAATLFHSIATLGEGVLHASPGSIGLVSLLEGVMIGFVGLLPLYILRAMGAGDVKLMMMVGAFLGPLQTLGVVVLTFLAGGVLAIVMALWQRSFRQLATNLRFMLTTSSVRAAGGESPRFEPLAQTAGRMPYAVAIAAGVVLQLVLVRSGGWALS
ncbi:A24 family peptidase [Aromatoleum aromaticum]|uniref:A24 family peptidase n=1 Tax=Aromatoleum aromaticum TaxID=551760 RepID=UPI0014591D10|nr:prepilin peptidase [Aromatoleum aromaticum]NMG55934.1 prepilin peptidase [Aromatoleum aromaticum]